MKRRSERERIIKGGGKNGLLVVEVKDIENSPTAYSNTTAPYRLPWS